jgi:hypothetical protein
MRKLSGKWKSKCLDADHAVTGGKRFSSPTTLMQSNELYLGREKPIFHFVSTELNNVSCLYENEDDEESI